MTTRAAQNIGGGFVDQRDRHVRAHSRQPCPAVQKLMTAQLKKFKGHSNAGVKISLAIMLSYSSMQGPCRLLTLHALELFGNCRTMMPRVKGCHRQGPAG